ncbi:hypothetical protein [Sphingomonas sp. TREG-RG-20F-R18-01]|nr:hypothetical protein [Sphingomonas sp. TREG-RG-20F-R18-01]
MNNPQMISFQKKAELITLVVCVGQRSREIAQTGRVELIAA